MVGRSVSGQPGIASIPDSVLVLWLKHSVKATHTDRQTCAGRRCIVQMGFSNAGAAAVPSHP